MSQLVLAPRAMVATPVLHSRATGFNGAVGSKLTGDDEARAFEQRPVRMGGAPLTGAHAVELYRRTQWLPTDVLVARVDLRA